MKNRWLILLLVLLVALLWGIPVAAADGVVEAPSLVDALSMLAQGAGVALVLAFLAERSPWFQGLRSDVKSWVIFGISLGLPLVAQILLQLVPAELWATLEPYWQAFAVGFIGWAGSQAAYIGLIKPASERERVSKILE